MSRFRTAFLTKPLPRHVTSRQTSGGGDDSGAGEEDEEVAKLPRRHMTLMDLVALGLGGTIGSGIFVLCGYIAKTHAGPATALSFLISGCCALLSGSCYAELAGAIPASGSAYTYVYTTMGEYFAVVAAACLTLEYLVRCAFFDRDLHSRMPLVSIPARLKLLHAFDQWHSSRVVTILPVDTVHSVQTLKVLLMLKGRRLTMHSATTLMTSQH
jgi:hypothetical protein